MDLDTSLVSRQNPTRMIPREENPRKFHFWGRGRDKRGEQAYDPFLFRKNRLFYNVIPWLHIKRTRCDLDEMHRQRAVPRGLVWPLRMLGRDCMIDGDLAAPQQYLAVDTH
jgi:hypothetical protein